MSRSTHLDMDRIVQEELREQRNKPGRLTSGNQEVHIRISEERGTLLNAEYGPQQVESLLRLVVDYPLHKAMEDALDDNDAIRHLEARKKNRRTKKRKVSY